jgi:hypothetical protein
MLNRIYIEVEDGGEGFSAYGDTGDENDTFLTDSDDLMDLLRKCKAYALEHRVEHIEIPVNTIPDGTS